MKKQTLTKQCRKRIQRFWFWAVCLCTLSLSTNAQQYERISEHQVKAVYLYNFSRFTAWPVYAFTSSDAPFNLCLLGEDPVNAELDLVVENEQHKGHPIQVQRLNEIQDSDHCQMLFIGKSETENIPHILDYLFGRPILTVSEIKDFAQHQGGMIEFYKKNNKIRFYIAHSVVKNASLQMSANLLRIATIIDEE